jgi:hypothetical protein
VEGRAPAELPLRGYVPPSVHGAFQHLRHPGLPGRTIKGSKKKRDEKTEQRNEQKDGRRLQSVSAKFEFESESESNLKGCDLLYKTSEDVAGADGLID